MINEEIAEKVFQTAIKTFYLSDSKETRGLFSSGAVFGFSLGSSEEFDSWEDAFLAYKFELEEK